jgi:hypothetical protein
MLTNIWLELNVNQYLVSQVSLIRSLMLVYSYIRRLDTLHDVGNFCEGKI